MSTKFKDGDKVYVLEMATAGEIVDVEIESGNKPSEFLRKYTVRINGNDWTGFSPEELVPYPVEFRVGDIVEALGVRGVVADVDSQSNYPVWVVFDSGAKDWFHSDGKSRSWHREPSLKLISRRKRKETRTIERWVNVYPDGSDSYGYFNKTEANNLIEGTPIACVKLTGTYEIEVEDES